MVEVVIVNDKSEDLLNQKLEILDKTYKLKIEAYGNNYASLSPTEGKFVPSLLSLECLKMR